MIYINKKITTGLFIAMCMILIPNCRGVIIPSEEDLSSYGWILYEKGDYLDALGWFGDAIEKDPTHYDAYNGRAWSMGHLRQADSSVYYFETYLDMDSSFADILDFYAGLSFAYNALGNNAQARNYCNLFFGNQNTILEGTWSFSHNEIIDYLDIYLILGVSEFRLGLFQNCQESINNIYKSTGWTVDSEWKMTEVSGSFTHVNVDYTTVLGRSELASHLAALQIELQN